MTQDYERTVQQVSDNARSLNRELGHVAENIASAQVAAARAMFNIGNAWMFGSLTPVVSKFEEGLHLYERTVTDIQHARDQVAEHMIHEGQSQAQGQGQRSDQRSQQQRQTA